MKEKSNYIFCKSFGYRIHLEICKKCTKKGCPIYKERVKKKKERAKKRSKKKREEALTKKIEKFEEEGTIRSLLLKPEDIVEVNSD
jgi:hypothetical protein